MKVIIVDDESLALRNMNKLLQPFEDIHVVGMFQDPRQALDYVLHEQVDLAFLDIEMPELHGMLLSEMLLRYQPQLHIVFVTAFNDYAVQAFEINALDYVLKPVQKQRLAKTIERLVKASKQQKVQPSITENSGMLLCLQSLSFQDRFNNIQPMKWRTVKAQELFAYLIHHRGKTVHREEIIELLWPGTPIEKSIPYLHTTIYQIRQTMKQLGIDLSIPYVDEGYCLQLGQVCLDVVEWEKGIQLSPIVSEETIVRHRQLLNMYRGDYMAEHAFLWAESEQERLRLIWLEHIKKIIQFYMQTNQYTEALLCYRKMQENHPYLEEGHLGLMKVNAILGYHQEVKKQFERLSQLFQEDLGIQPGREVLDWYELFISARRSGQ